MLDGGKPDLFQALRVKMLKSRARKNTKKRKKKEWHAKQYHSLFI
ncbi:MAG: hypothetical protein ACI96P_001127 [Candidatus Azotimanducaceae bacterium]|jgi:hypothetical protein